MKLRCNLFPRYGSQMRINQIVLSTIFVLTSTGVVGAQGAGPLSDKRIGVVVGMSSSTVSGDNAQNPSRLAGAIVGIFLHVPVALNFAIQPELIWSMKGAKYSVNEPLEFVTERVHEVDYAEIPIMLRFDVPSLGGVRPFVYGGPAISFKFSCNVRSEALGISSSQDCEEAAHGSLQTNRLDYGLVVGGGLAFDFSGKTFSLGARYDRGLADINRGNTKNRVISLMATLEFPFVH